MITRVQNDYDSNVFFPEIDYSEWHITETEEHKDIYGYPSKKVCLIKKGSTIFKKFVIAKKT